MTATDAGPLTAGELDLIDAWWRAANYLSVGQIYLLDNPLLTEALQPEHVKPRLLGHWGTTPGLNLHLRAPQPGHQELGPGRHLHHRARARRPGARGEHLPGGHLQRACTRPSARTRTGCGGSSGSSPSPAASRSHVAPETPGSIHEGGELGYSLAHAYGAAFDNPDLIVACVIGDGEAETGPLAGQLARQQVPQPGDRRRGAADPAPQRVQDRQPDGARRGSRRRAASRCSGYGYTPLHRRGRRPGARAPGDGRHARRDRRRDPRHPAAGPRGDGEPSGRAGRCSCCARPRAGPGRRWSTGCRSRAPGGHTRCRSPRRAPTPSTCASSRSGCAPTDPEELFDAGGALRPRDRRRWRPCGYRRMSANPHANGGLLLRDLDMPDFRDYAVDGPAPGGDARGEHPRARRLPAGHHRGEPRELPALGTGRDGVEPARRGVRRDRPGLRRRRSSPATTTWPRTAG